MHAKRFAGWFAMLAIVGLAASAHAEKDRFDQGESVPVFTLKSLNPSDSGMPYVGIDTFFGDEAKDPKKAILLSFFATYCEPCKREVPYLQALYGLYKEKGLMVMSVSIDTEAEKIEFAKTLAKEHSVEFPVLSDRFNIVARRYMIEKLPCVYVINSEGKVAMVSLGYDDDISKQMLMEIRKLVGESASDPIPDALVKHMPGAAAHKDAPAAADADAPAAEADAGGEGKGDAVAPAAEPKERKKKRKRKKRRGKRRRRKKK